jgi:Tfp pilus assembly protein FimV
MSTMTIDQMFGPRPAAQSVTEPATRRSTVRLTRRGRLVVLTLALLAVLAAGIVIASGSVATDQPGTPEPTRVVMVGSGDTLWDIAADAAPDGDVRAMIDRIERLNALDTGMVSAGQKLLVPTD